MEGILSGVRILDLTQMKTGPMGTQLLGDLGADIIKVERTGLGDWERSFPAFGQFTETGASSFFLAMNRNKRSLAIDLKTPEAKKILYKLAESTDVVVQNFRPGVLNRLGFGYKDFWSIKPDIIYCSNSGFGESGPYEARPGQDLLAQAMSGMVLMNGTKEQPLPVATTVADGVTSVYLALGIMGALIHKMRTGEGQEVNVDLLSSLLALQQEELSAFMNLKPTPSFERSTNGVPAPWMSAPYGVYTTSDERHIAIAMNPLNRLGVLLSDDNIAAQADPNTAFMNRDQLRTEIQAHIKTKPLQEWLSLFLTADVWCAPVQTYNEVLSDPQVLHNHMVSNLNHPQWGDVGIIGTPIRYSKTPPTYRTPPPVVGEHSVEILRQSGFAETEIQSFVEKGVITQERI